MKTQVEIEAAVCEHLAPFAQDYLGLRPRTIRAYLLPSLLVVRLQGMLTVAEQQLLLMSGTGNSRDMIKQMRVEVKKIQEMWKILSRWCAMRWHGARFFLRPKTPFCALMGGDVLFRAGVMRGRPFARIARGLDRSPPWLFEECE